MNKSILESSGYTKTEISLNNWCMSIIKMVQSELNTTKELSAHVWSYRNGNIEYYALDISNQESSETIPCTMAIVGYNRFDETTDSSVCDASEALHGIGIILRALNLKPTIGK